jgi:hypothetical protein
MTILGIVALLIGIMLGQRFRVLILLPAISFALIVAIGASVVRADNGWSIVLTAVAVTIALQIGYLIGSRLRSFIAAGSAVYPYRGPTGTPRAGRHPAPGRGPSRTLTRSPAH